MLTDKTQCSLAHKVFSAQQVRDLEAEAAANSACSMYSLMERAGRAVFEAVQASWPSAKSLLVMVGTGNNGGDGYVLARLALAQGWQVTLAAAQVNKPLQGDALRAQQAWLAAGGQITDVVQVDLNGMELIVDALLGTGLQGTVRAPYDSLIKQINQAKVPVVSVDIPSGLHTDTGQVLGSAVQACLTVTFVGIKSGLVTGTGKQYCGELRFDDLGIGEAFSALAAPRAELLCFADLASLAARKSNAHKGHFGRLLCIGGNAGMGGAIRLCAEAALRCGTGLVKVFCHRDSRAQVANGRPELMLASDDLTGQLDWADCIAVGPGLGQDTWGQDLFARLSAYLSRRDLPVVLDADGLNLMAKGKPQLRPSRFILTPHPTEAARLLGTNVTKVEADRYGHAWQLAQKFSAVCVLKGAGSLVQSDAHTFVCKDGNPGMATAGMGDVLTGVCAAFLVQGSRLGLDESHAALYAACLHAAAGDLAATELGQNGMLASDLFFYLRKLINQ